jgi:putative flavoprotein involved in K+ transport
MTAYTETVIVGGGQAGLAVSYYLGEQGRDHLVLEQADKVAEAWRNHRWDSFTLNTPNWQSRLPGAGDPVADPHGFFSREQIVHYFETYARRFRLPVRYGAPVSSVERDPRSGSFLLLRSRGASEFKRATW